MQETISFEIGGQTYKLVGNNKELTEKSAAMVNDKYNSIIGLSQAAANNKEVAFMLTALNLAEETLHNQEVSTVDDKLLSEEVDKMIKYVQDEIDKLIIR